MKSTIKNLIIVVVVILLVVFGYYALKGKTLKSDSDQVKSLYSYLGSNDLSVCNGLFIYDDKEISNKDLTEENKRCISYSLINENDISKLKVEAESKKDYCNINDDISFAVDDKDNNMCNITRFDVKTIKDNYKKIYGKELEELNDFNPDSRTICKSDGEYYYCGFLEEFTVIVGSEPKVYRSIDVVKDKNDSIEIYDYFIKMINDDCYYNYVTTTKNEKCSAKYNKDDVSFSFLRKYGTKYKHTFVKGEDNNYHWSKSEPIK